MQLVFLDVDLGRFKATNEQSPSSLFQTETTGKAVHVVFVMLEEFNCLATDREN